MGARLVDLVLFPAYKTLAAIRRLPRPKDREAAQAFFEVLPQYEEGTRLLLRFAITVAGKPNPN